MKRAFATTLTLFLAAGTLLRAQDLTTGLIAHYPLDEASGTNAAEMTAGKNGTLDGTPLWLSPGLQFAGAEKVTTPADTANGITNAITLALWVRMDPGGTYGQPLLEKKTFALYFNAGVFYVQFNGPGVTGGTGGVVYHPFTTVGLATGVWRHLAVTSDGSLIKMYVDGTLVEQVARNVTLGTTTEPLVMGYRDPALSSGGYLKGAMRDVRVYDRALDSTEIAAIGGLLSQAYAGLWIGRATLNEVKEIATGSWSSAPAFQETVLLHVDQSGAASLLAEATLMQTRVTPPAQPEPLVITQPSLLPNYDGVTLRGGRRIGQRFSSATMPLPSDTVPLTKVGQALSATFTLPAASPINPFRHKYHPDLGTGRDLTRTTGITFAAGESPSDHVLEATCTESIDGLHKTALEARGPITFTRVSMSGKLNQP